MQSKQVGVMKSWLALWVAMAVSQVGATDYYYWRDTVAQGLYTETNSWSMVSASGAVADSTPNAADGDTVRFYGVSAQVGLPAATTQEFYRIELQDGGNTDVNFAFPVDSVLRCTSSGVSIGREDTLSLTSGMLDMQTKTLSFQNGGSLSVVGSDATLANCSPRSSDIVFWHGNARMLVKDGAKVWNSYLLHGYDGGSNSFVASGDGTVLSNVVLSSDRPYNSVSITNGVQVRGGQIFLSGNTNSLLILAAEIGGGTTLGCSGGSGSTVRIESGAHLALGSMSLYGWGHTAVVSDPGTTLSGKIGVGVNYHADNLFVVTNGAHVTGRVSLGVVCATNNVFVATGQGSMLEAYASSALHVNDSLFQVGYSSSPTNGGCYNAAIVDDSALVILSTNAPANFSATRGLTIGVSTTSDHNQLSILGGATLSNMLNTAIGNVHPDWGGGSYGRLIVSNATFYGLGAVYINGGANGDKTVNGIVCPRLSRGNSLLALDGAHVQLGSDVYFGSTTNSGGGTLLCRNSEVKVNAGIRSLYAQNFGANTLACEGTNGTITARYIGITYPALAPMVLSFVIPEAGRTTDGAYLQLTGLSGVLPTSGVSLQLDVDRYWAVKGNDVVVDLVSVPTSSTDVTAAFQNLIVSVSAEALNGCSLEIAEEGTVLRLHAGNPPGTVIVLK